MLNADIIRKDDDRHQVMVMVDGMQNIMPSMAQGLNPKIRELCIAYDFFLGWSADYSIWLLWAVDRGDPVGRPSPGNLAAWLTDPPEKNLDVIAASRNS